MADYQKPPLVRRVIRLLQSDCRETLKTLDAGSVQTCVTSPPYYGLRDYGTPPLVWGGIEHEHEWGARVPARGTSNWDSFNDYRREGFNNRSAAGKTGAIDPTTKATGHGSFCSCGAWLGSLGLEPTPELFIEHLVDVFREVKRVLRDDGVMFVNLGDSYAGSGKGKPGKEGIQSSASQMDRVKYPDLVDGRHDGYHHVVDYEARPRWPTYSKPKNLLMMPFRVAMALQADGWYLRSVIPWLKRNCLSGGARVYVRSQKGDMPMTVKDLARLDPKTCKLWNGERWTQVIGIWEARPDEGDPIEIELRSGERIGCTPEHRWPTERGLLPAFALRVGDVLKGGWLPKPDARQPAALDDEDVGWFVGLYVAEGSRSKGTIQIASHAKETERFERLCRVATAFDGTCRAHLKGANGMTINLTGPVLNAIIDQYVGGRLADDKHLTNRCWMRSNEFLRAVLDGYLHGDGHWDVKNQRWRLGFTRNYAWEGDLRTIAARLNLDLRLKLATIPYDGRDVGIFRGSLRFERTTKLWTKNEREIMRIGHSRGRKFWDVSVEDDPHTFALASGVLTHNSMPESVTDRPSTSVEYVFMLSKSNDTTFWTHRNHEGSRTRPIPDYRWIHKVTKEEVDVDPGNPNIWRRINLWSGHDYFWDADAVRERLSAHAERLSAAGWRQPADHKTASTRNDGRDGGINTKDKTYGEKINPAGRNRRNADWFMESWQGLMLDEQDDPLALVVNPMPFTGAHFAVFPTTLVTPMIKASTSERGQCPECRAPWVRTTGVAQVEPDLTQRGTAHYDTADRYGADNGGNGGLDALAARMRSGIGSTTTGWRPSCAHADITPVPQVVLDCFSGAGTVGLVADRLGRDAILCELKESYADMGADRIIGDNPMFTELDAS